MEMMPKLRQLLDGQPITFSKQELQEMPEESQKLALKLMRKQAEDSKETTHRPRESKVNRVLEKVRKIKAELEAGTFIKRKEVYDGFLFREKLTKALLFEMKEGWYILSNCCGYYCGVVTPMEQREEQWKDIKRIGGDGCLCEVYEAKPKKESDGRNSRDIALKLLTEDLNNDSLKEAHPQIRLAIRLLQANYQKS